MTPEEEARRGADARLLLENKIYREAVQETEAGLLRAMKGAALGDESTHHRLVIALQLLGQIVKHIESVAQTGEMAEIKLKENIGRRLKRAAGF